MLMQLPQITSFYGQSQFQKRFGTYNADTNAYTISAPWQSGLSNSSAVGQLFGLLLNAYAQDKFGCRPTMMFFMAWMAVMIFIPFFAPSLSVLAFGEAMCGVSWGVFQVRSTQLLALSIICPCISILSVVTC
jgi:MFS transporter, SP family, general alpha glucoside:H+ symporter